MEPNIDNLIKQKKLSESNTDFLRSIKISDSKPLLEYKISVRDDKQAWRNKTITANQAAMAEIIIASYDENKKAKNKSSIFAEIVCEVQTEFTITLDRDMLSWFKHNQQMQLPFNSIEDILAICQEFAEIQWNNERHHWEENIRNYRNLNFDMIRDFYRSQTSPYNLRIGWGSGMTGTTISLCYEDRKLVRQICDNISRNQAPKFEAPKSRRTIVNSEEEIRYVPGWVKLTPL